ncbi:hypothetical protein BO83DRAFT_220139 [Aspergillus eucalypticola CBS 122712]|uniref:Uncharacterized protein n=1 Tax=Aspergillus eucalypticola (strain CBS 122712 / IBT 29274) TaxID=1448314 RepID=A0A317VTB5_ASPEC|nr:uncharacterized protein BO83DRAFT_220139 [Aspergillus eucalypticola CBS 122712]PWY77563.1 hypothetical protein BO83DRAFT_220139 [Aspergillus eucalypticola CBS 122712]
MIPMPITGRLNHPFDKPQRLTRKSAEEPTRSPSLAWPGIESVFPSMLPLWICSGHIDPVPCVSCDAVVQIQIYTKKGILRVYYLHRAISTIPVTMQGAGDGMLGQRGEAKPLVTED